MKKFLKYNYLIILLYIKKYNYVDRLKWGKKNIIKIIMTF